MDAGFRAIDKEARFFAGSSPRCRARTVPEQ